MKVVHLQYANVFFYHLKDIQKDRAEAETSAMFIGSSKEKETMSNKKKHTAKSTFKKNTILKQKPSILDNELALNCQR